MLLVGLTGGIGSGKSTVAALLAERGAVIVDADQIARQLQAPGSPLLAQMAARFGAHIIRDDGSLDRAAVAAIVFGDAEPARLARRDLNAITHPAIHAEIDRRLAELADTDSVVVLDHPLLGEDSPWPLAATVVVDVDPAIAVERLVRWRAMDADDARRRIASQISREQRRALATDVLDNNGDRQQLTHDVDDLWEKLLALRAKYTE